MADESKVIDVIAGPYRGQRLSVSAADFDKAIADKWAVDPFEEKAPPDPENPEDPPPMLSDEERKAALEAAHAWRDEQVEVAKGPQPKDEAHGERAPKHRELAPEDKPGGYTTRQVTPPAPPAAPPRTRR